MNRDHHIPQLDGLRGVAILLVLSLHTLGGAPGRSVIDNAINIGWIGVDLFFVLSGFLITTILLVARGSAGFFTNFYARRALRIWPLYYLVVLFAYAAVPWLDPDLRFDTGTHPAGSYILFIQNLVPPIQFGPWPVQVTWSLAIEEQFYLVWPLLVWSLGDRALSRLLVTLILLTPLLRLWALLSGAAPISVYIVTPFRIDALAAGGLAALLMRSVTGGENMDRLRHVYRALLCLLPVAVTVVILGIDGDRLIVSTTPASLFDALVVTTAFSLLALGFAGLLMFVIDRPLSPVVPVLSSRPLRYIGMVSFGLYLYHGILIPLFNFYARPALSTLPAPAAVVWIVNQVVFYVLLFAVADLSWRFLEAPILKFKRRFA